MPIAFGTIAKTIKENVLLYSCDMCGKTALPVEHSCATDELNGWIEVRPLGYSCDMTYHKCYCPDCAKKKDIMVGRNHEKWNS